ncbi:SWIM zinc finger family protein [Bdellovibrionota bacterium FG-2]
MQNQKQIQKKIQAVTSVANSEFSESHISPAMLTHALKLIDSDVVAIVAVSPEGVLSGEVLDRKTAGTFECSVHLLPYGTFRVPFCSCGKGQTTQEGILCEHVLALTLHFAHLLGSKKLKPGLKKLLVAAPEWLRERYQLNVNLGNNVQDEIIRGIKLKNLKDLQAYWMLLEMASEGKQKIPAEVLVQHVLSIYESAAWGVKRAAMEAVLRRIGSVKLEDLHIASHLGRPANGQVFGFYRVHSRLRAAKRPYDVLLASPVGIDGSCSCPDFRKNTLGFCKHLASVMIHWNSSESLRARFTKSRPQFTTRLRWLPNTGLAGMAGPLAGMEICGGVRGGGV